MSKKVPDALDGTNRIYYTCPSTVWAQFSCGHEVQKAKAACNGPCLSFVFFPMSLIPVPLPSPTLLLIRAAASASATVNGTAPRASSSAAPPSNVTHYSGPFGTEWSVKADSTRDMIGMSACAILAVTVTILQVMHCVCRASSWNIRQC